MKRSGIAVGWSALLGLYPPDYQPAHQSSIPTEPATIDLLGRNLSRYNAIAPSVIVAIYHIYVGRLIQIGNISHNTSRRSGKIILQII
jgi:hypothetical protein